LTTQRCKTKKIKSLLYDLLTKRSGVLTIGELQHREEEIGKEASNQTQFLLAVVIRGS
jgi:hypothetical protein